MLHWWRPQRERHRFAVEPLAGVVEIDLVAATGFGIEVEVASVQIAVAVAIAVEVGVVAVAEIEADDALAQALVLPTQPVAVATSHWSSYEPLSTWSLNSQLNSLLLTILPFESVCPMTKDK